jgi:hypothetical protein
VRKERSDVKFIMWRKRVDKTLLKTGITPIPAWLVEQWDFDNIFDFSKGSIKVIIHYGNESCNGFVSKVKYKNRDLLRLKVKDRGHKWIINSFVSTFDLLVTKGLSEETFEFLDIEFDPNTCDFYLNDYYKTN